MTEQIRDIVIVGGGLAGAKAAEAARGEGFAGQLTVIADEGERPYERPPLSKGFLLGEKTAEETYVHPAGFYAEHDIDLHLDDPATEIDRAAGEVLTRSGGRTRFDRLLLATGAEPRRLPLAGEDLDGIVELRTLDDSRRLAERLRGRPRHRRRRRLDRLRGRRRRAHARRAGHHGRPARRPPRPRPRRRGRAGVRRPPRRPRRRPAHGRGRRHRPGNRRRRAHHPDRRHRRRHRTRRGRHRGRPAHRARRASRASGRRRHRRRPDPDELRPPDPRRGRCRPRLASPDGTTPARGTLGQRPQPGTVAGRDLLGADESYERVPYFFTDQYDLGMEYTGHAPDWDTVVFRGAPDQREFLAFWLADGRVVAGMNVNVWDVVEDIQHLIRSARPVDPTQLADPDVPLRQAANTAA